MTDSQIAGLVILGSLAGLTALLYAANRWPDWTVVVGLAVSAVVLVGLAGFAVALVAGWQPA